MFAKCGFRYNIMSFTRILHLTHVLRVLYTDAWERREGWKRRTEGRVCRLIAVSYSDQPMLYVAKPRSETEAVEDEDALARRMFITFREVTASSLSLSEMEIVCNQLCACQ